MKTNPALHYIARLAAGLLAFAFARAAYCQEASPDPRPPAPNEEPIKLDDFKVTASTALGRYTETESTTATKLPVAMKELAVSLQILNASAITDRKALTIADVYTYVVGMTQVTLRSTGFALRGFDTTNTGVANLQTDGLPGNISEFGSSQTANIDRVEILKGPNSILYGELRVGGAVNIVTKSPKQKRQTTINTTLTTYAGEFSGFGDSNQISTMIDTTGPIDEGKKWLYRFVVQGSDKTLWRPDSFERGIQVFPSLTYNWSSNTSLTIRGEFTREKRKADDGLVAPFNSVELIAPFDTVYQLPTDYKTDSGQALAAQFKTTFGPWTFNLSTRTVWAQNFSNMQGETNTTLPVSRTPIETSTIARRVRQQWLKNRFNFFDLNAFATLGSPDFEHKLVLGAGGGRYFNYNLRQQRNSSAVNVYTPDPFTPVPPFVSWATSNPLTFRDSGGIYALDQIKIKEKLHLVAGARRSRTKQRGVDPASATPTTTRQEFDSTVLQFGAVYDLTPEISVYGNRSESFFPNSIVGVDATGRVGFPPEEGLQYELGLKYEAANKKLRANLTAYEIEKANVLTNTGAVNPVLALPIFRLDGAQISRGIEFEIAWFPYENWQVQAGGSYIDAYIEQSANSALIGRQLISAPNWSGNFWTRYNVPSGRLRGFGVGQGIIYVGDRRGGDPSTVNGYPVVPSYTRFDTAIYYRWRNCEFALNIQNILDRRYVSTVTNSQQVYPGDPRKIALSVNLKF